MIQLVAKENRIQWKRGLYRQRNQGWTLLPGSTMWIWERDRSLTTWEFHLRIEARQIGDRNEG